MGTKKDGKRLEYLKSIPEDELTVDQASELSDLEEKYEKTDEDEETD